MWMHQYHKISINSDHTQVILGPPASLAYFTTDVMFTSVNTTLISVLTVTRYFTVNFEVHLLAICNDVKMFPFLD